MSHSAQVACTLLPDGGHESDSGPPPRVLPAVLQQRQQYGQAGAVIAYPGGTPLVALLAHRDIGVQRKDGVEVGGQHHAWAFAARNLGDDVTYLVSVRLEAHVPEEAGDECASLCLLERRCWCFGDQGEELAQLDLLVDGLPRSDAHELSRRLAMPSLRA